MNRLTYLWQHMFGSASQWITNQQRLWRPRRNLVRTNAHGTLVDAITLNPNLIVQRTAHDERAAAVSAALEIMRRYHPQPRPLAGSETAASFGKPTREDAGLVVPYCATGRRIRLGQSELGLEKLALMILLILGGMYGVMALKYVNIQSVADQNERALALVIANDVIPIRLAPAPGVPAATRGTYWGQVGADIAVLDLSDLPATPQAARYHWWVEHAHRWTSMGIATPDAAGNARLIAESPELATPPDGVQVTRDEPDDGSLTLMASGVLIWPAR